MQQNGYVSVLIPALNEESTIERAIESALSQRDVEVEVIVANGMSVDRTKERALAMSAKYPGQIKVLDNPHSSIPSGLNLALAVADGEFVARIDAHSVARPDYLARGVARLRSDDRLAGVGGMRRGVSDTSTGRAVALALSSRFGVGNSVNHYGTRYQLTDHASHGVYRSTSAREIGGWDEELLVNEDVDFDLRLIASGHTIAYDPAMVFDWKVRDTPAALARQYRRYGRGKAKMVRKNGPSAMRARHLAAPMLVVGSVMAIPAVARSPKAALVFAPYVGGLLAASVRAWQRRTPGQAVSPGALPGSFVAMHYGWGLGFLEGLLSSAEPASASGTSHTVVAMDQADPPSPDARPIPRTRRRR